MEYINVFSNEEIGKLEVIFINGKAMFEGKQVATGIGYRNYSAAINRHCDIEGVAFRDVGVVTGKKSDGTEIIQYVQKKFIDEGNVYRLILNSKLPSAKRFEKWIMDEVLPSIRKNGAYMSTETIEKTLENPDFIIKLATKLKEEKIQRCLSERKVKELEQKIVSDKPYTNFGKSMATVDDAITIGQFAKLIQNNEGIPIGRNRLFKFLRDSGYLMKQCSESNIPIQTYVEQGLFKVDEYIVQTEEGPLISTKTLITGKGQVYLLDKITKDYIY